METLESGRPRQARRWHMMLRVTLLIILSQCLWEVGKFRIVPSAKLQSFSPACSTSNAARAASKASNPCRYPNMNHFDAMYIMYMPQRKQYMEQVVDHYGFSDCFDISYVPAVNRSSIDKQWFQTKGFISAPFKLGIGKIANHLTLLKTLRLFLFHSENADSKAQNRKDHSWMESRCIILEDDISIVDSEELPEWWQHFSNIAGDMKPLNWDYVNFGRCYASCKSDDHLTTDIVHYTQAACTHAVGYSYAGAMKAMQTYLPLPDRSNDLMIADLIRSGKFDGKAYQITPIVFKQNKTMGSILMDHGKSWEKPECTDSGNR